MFTRLRTSKKGGSGGLALKTVLVLVFYFVGLSIFMTNMLNVVDERSGLGLNPDPDGTIGFEGGFDINSVQNETLGISPGDSVSGRGVFTTLYEIFFFKVNFTSSSDTFTSFYWVWNIIFAWLPLTILIVAIASAIWI